MAWAASLSLDPLGAMHVRRITESDLRAWHSRQTNAPATTKNRLAWIVNILADAGNPVRYRAPRSEGHERRPLSSEELSRLRAVLGQATETERTAVLLCLELGLRRSEALGLRHEDREGRGVRLQRVVVKTTGQITIKGRGKTARSKGWIPLPPSLAWIGQGKGYVLGGETPMRPGTFSETVKGVLARAGVRVPYGGPHALRRTYGMILLESGVDVVTTAGLMRHSPEVLLREYARTREDLKLSAVERAFGNPQATSDRKQEK